MLISILSTFAVAVGALAGSFLGLVMLGLAMIVVGRLMRPAVGFVVWLADKV